MLKKGRKSQINNLNFHLKKLKRRGKEAQNKQKEENNRDLVEIKNLGVEK